MAKKDFVKRAFIAGAGMALKYKEKKPNASESEVMSHVTKEMEKVIREIEKSN
ncbi:MAG: hypothetical protein KatS3mg093_432 [Candidatus Parcubacteria bacterium]|nr:MAG: hypothetical protein KatS3mg001_525 [Candidatus Pacearchaeota archaeon]GIW65453.1 MAG: hypothetical protein KatS3mg093_432 [Candidatus Parcubacteria bacterium]